MEKKHYIYRTSHTNGKYYIGRHTTDDISKPYYGSGKWVQSIKDKSKLNVEILIYASSFQELLQLEEKFIQENINNPNNMNFNNSSQGWGSGEFSHARTEIETVRKRRARIGKTYEELFGADKAMQIRQKISKKQKGKKRGKAWNTGLTKDNSPALEKMSQSKQGSIPWNKGKKGVQVGSMLGRKHTDEALEKIRHRAKNRQSKSCPYCQKEISPTNFQRWHGENCKLKDENRPIR